MFSVVLWKQIVCVSWTYCYIRCKNCVQICAMCSMDNKVAIVTGAAQGIGKAHCIALLEKGAKVKTLSIV